MPALVAAKIMVSTGTFSWNSILNLRRHPPTSSMVMVATVGAVVLTQHLSLGVLTGVLLPGIFFFFAGKVQRMFRVERHLEGDAAVYRVTGQVFFASVERFTRAFDTDEPVRRVQIDVSAAHFWDIRHGQS
jgi:sulfate permease, SulP family